MLIVLTVVAVAMLLTVVKGRAAGETHAAAYCVCRTNVSQEFNGFNARALYYSGAAIGQLPRTTASVPSTSTDFVL